MDTATDPTRAFRIVTGVVGEALRASRRAAVVISGGGPEETVLRGWLETAGIPWEPVTTAALEAARRVVVGSHGEASHGGRSPSGWSMEAEASALAGAAQARARGLLQLGTANKTCILLSPTAPPQAVLPLGDLYASEIQALAGSCTLPPCLQGVSQGIVQDVDLALRAYLEEGSDQGRAFAGLDAGLRLEILAALADARRAWHPLPLVPKLSRATLGIDLDL